MRFSFQVYTYVETIYKLKQSLRQWYMRFDNYMSIRLCAWMSSVHEVMNEVFYDGTRVSNFSKDVAQLTFNTWQGNSEKGLTSSLHKFHHSNDLTLAHSPPIKSLLKLDAKPSYVYCDFFVPECTKIQKERPCFQVQHNCHYIISPISPVGFDSELTPIYHLA